MSGGGYLELPQLAAAPKTDTGLGSTSAPANGTRLCSELNWQAVEVRSFQLSLPVSFCSGSGVYPCE